MSARRPCAARLAFVAALTLVAACGPRGEEADGSAAVAFGAAAAESDWRRSPAASGHPPGRALQTAFLVVDGVYNSELMAPYDVFHHTRFHTDPEPGMEVFTVSPDGQPVTTFEGLILTPDHSFRTAPPIDILVVPSAEHSMDSDLDNGELIEWVRRIGTEADFVVSLCDGTFVLAAAGLLDEVACTTFPGDLDAFERRFPQLDVRRQVSFVHDGARLTSQGGARSYDVAMHLVDHLYGERVARGVGGGLILSWPPRPGDLQALVVERQAAEDRTTEPVRPAQPPSRPEQN